MQQIINNVSDGFYPSMGNLSCTSPAVTGSGTGLEITPSSVPGQGAEGTNQECVYLGDVVQFYPSQSGTPSGYNTYTVAGSAEGYDVSTTTATGYPPQFFDEALPTAIDDTGPATGGDVVQNVNLTVNKQMEWGAQVTAVDDYTSTTTYTTISSFGFFGSLASHSSTSLNSGSQSTVAIPIVASSGSAVGSSSDTEPVTVDDIDDTTNGVVDANVVANPDIVVCVKGNTGQYGTLTIGGSNGQRLTTTVAITQQPTGGCPS